MKNPYCDVCEENKSKSTISKNKVNQISIDCFLEIKKESKKIKNLNFFNL
jgi:hypothetical protein